MCFFLFFPSWDAYIRINYRRSTAWSDFSKPYGLMTLEEIIEKRIIKWRWCDYDSRKIQRFTDSNEWILTDSHVLMLCVISQLKEKLNLTLQIEPIRSTKHGFDYIRVAVLQHWRKRLLCYFYPNFGPNRIAPICIDILENGYTCVADSVLGSYEALDRSDPRFIDKLTKLIKEKLL